MILTSLLHTHCFVIYTLENLTYPEIGTLFFPNFYSFLTVILVPTMSKFLNFVTHRSFIQLILEQKHYLTILDNVYVCVKVLIKVRDLNLFWTDYIK